LIQITGNLGRGEAMSKCVVKIMFGLTAVAVVIGMAAAGAEAQVNAMSGKATLKYTAKTVVPVGDAEGHILMVADATGLNTNTGKWDFMSGAVASSRGTADLTKGNGPQSGYFILTKEGSQTVAKYTGTVKTILSPEGKPLTSISGEWKYVSCGGAYAGCTGQGGYQGDFLSQDEYVVEFKGILVQ
jgi:hypothetical protein